MYNCHRFPIKWDNCKGWNIPENTVKLIVFWIISSLVIKRMIGEPDPQHSEIPWRHWFSDLVVTIFNLTEYFLQHNMDKVITWLRYQTYKRAMMCLWIFWTKNLDPIIPESPVFAVSLPPADPTSGVSIDCARTCNGHSMRGQLLRTLDCACRFALLCWRIRRFVRWSLLGLLSWYHVIAVK